MFLAILSVIGKILLIILGVILVLVLLVLFVPVRYKANILKNGEFMVEGKVSWLLNFVRFTFTFQNMEFDWELKILFFSLKDLLTGKKKKKRIEKKKEAKRPPTIMPGEKPDKKVIKNAEEAAKAEMKIKQGQQKENYKIYAPNERAPSLFEKIKTFFKMLPDRIRKFISIAAAYRATKKLLFKIIRHVLPRSISGSLLFGFDDPSLTGKILGLICVFYPLIPKDLKITPEFQKSVLECDVWVKGRIIVIYVGVLALRILFSKEVKTVLGREKGGK